MKDFLIQIVKALVDNPEQVSVNEIEASHTTILELRVAKEDIMAKASRDPYLESCEVKRKKQ
jgi:predicted RNA-binding protein YlqC (UPF0109 family)